MSWGRKIGFKGTLIYNIVKGKNFGVDKFIKLVRFFPDINVNWLLLGEGTMYHGTENNEEEEHSTEKQKNERLQQEIAALRSKISYQEMALSAYKHAMEMAMASNEDLKSILNYYEQKTE